MENETDEFEEEVENLEKEEEVKEKKEKTEKKPEEADKKEEPTERYVVLYQEQRIGIIDTVTEEVIIDGLQDYPTARLETIKLNKLDKIENVTGIN